MISIQIIVDLVILCHFCVITFIFNCVFIFLVSVLNHCMIPDVTIQFSCVQFSVNIVFSNFVQTYISPQIYIYKSAYSTRIEFFLVTYFTLNLNLLIRYTFVWGRFAHTGLTPIPLDLNGIFRLCLNSGHQQQKAP